MVELGVKSVKASFQGTHAQTVQLGKIMTKLKCNVFSVKV